MKLFIDIFYGQIISTTKALEGDHVSNIYTPMCYFTLPIPNNIENLNVYDCLDNFTQKEILDGDEQWFCEEIDKKSMLQNK